MEYPRILSKVHSLLSFLDSAWHTLAGSEGANPQMESTHKSASAALNRIDGVGYQSEVRCSLQGQGRKIQVHPSVTVSEIKISWLRPCFTAGKVFGSSSPSLQSTQDFHSVFRPEI